MKSILAVDCGSTTTTAVLIEQTGREHQLKAAGQSPSTYGPPWENITLGVQVAVRHIEKLVGRMLLTSGGWPITPQSGQQGVDAFVVTCSAGPPLQLVVAGLMQDISLSSAQRAAATTYTYISHTVALDAQDPLQQNTPEAWIQAIRRGDPEVILLVGGTDGGAAAPVIEMAQVIAMAMHALQSGQKPLVLYAGNSHIRPQIADILGTVTALRSVDNIRPTLNTENLVGVQLELEKLVQEKMLQLPDFDNLSSWTKYPIEPASKSFEKLIAYLGRHNRLNVIGVNIGSRSTMASGQAQQQLNSTIRSDAGVGHSLAALLKCVAIEKIHRWLPFDISLAELYNRLLNKSLYPASVPTTAEDLLIEQAVAREAARLVVNQTRFGPDIQWHMIIGAGRPLTGLPHAAQAALVMMDAIEPWGVTSLTLDHSGVVNMLGSIAAVDSMAAATVATRDAFFNLATVIAPTGHGQFGKTALKIKINYAQGKPVEKEISYGDIQVINLPPGHKATLEIRPARHFDIGLGQPGRSAVTEIEGSILGIIIDARGRPLRLPNDHEQRINLLREWLLALDIQYATSNQSN